MSKSEIPTLVFIHGNSSSSNIFDKQNHLSNHLIIDDLPGHGKSRIKNREDYSIHNMKKGLISKYQSIDNTVLFGHSLGGHLAMEIAPFLPSLKALVLFGAPPVRRPLNIDEAFNAEILGPFLKSDYDRNELIQAIDSFTYIKQHNEFLINEFVQTDPVFRDVLSHSVSANEELSDEVAILEKLDIPVYFIQGMQDPLIKKGYLHKIAGATKIYEIDNCGHYASLEQPERFNEILEEILEEIGSDE